MTRQFLLLLTLLAVASTLSATNYTFGLGDLVPPNYGAASNFQINSATFSVYTNTSQAWTVTLNLNYDNGAAGFGNWQFDSSVILSPADLFFTINGADAYGVATVSHTNSPNASSAERTNGQAVVAGDLYKINNSSGVLTAQDVLGNTPDTYRFKAPVWLWNNGSSITQVGLAGTSTVTPGGIGKPYQVVLSFTPDQTLVNALSNQTLGFSFGNADCANWLMQGKFGVPEPTSMLLCGAGLLGLGMLVRRRARRS